MKKFILTFLLLFSNVVIAGGLNASFTGSRFDCPNDPSVVFCSKAVVDGSNNLIDYTENLLTDRVEFDDWGEGGTCAVTADQYRNPVNGAVDADYLDNSTDTNGRRELYSPSLTAIGRIFTGSVWIRSDYSHICTLRLYDTNGVAIIATEYFVVDTVWKRFSVTGVGVGGAVGQIGLIVYPGERAVATGTAYFYGGQLIENDEYRTGMGYFVNPTDQAITKPNHTLADTNDPTTTKAHVQIQGNKGPARDFDGANQYYSKADHASLGVFDSDHTITSVALVDDVTGDPAIVSKGTYAVSGVLVQIVGANINAYYSNGGGAVTVAGPAFSLNQFHVVQVIRDSDLARVCVDGTCGASVDVTGYGIDNVVVFSVGAHAVGFNDMRGQISYTVLRSRALSDDELAEEREMLWGIYTNWSSVNQWSFDRSTVAYKTFSNAYENTYPSHSMDLVPANVPRVTDSLLIGGQVTQLHGLTEEFDSWMQQGVCAVTANDYIAPNGTLTADELDNTGGAVADRRQVQTANLGDLTGRTFTHSVYIRAATPHNCTIRIYENPVGNIGISIVYVTNEWQRFDISGAAAGGGDGTIYVMNYPGENIVATGIAHFWGANLTETTFATSYVPNAGVGVSQVTRTADDISIAVLEAGTNNRILADEYCQNCAADKITIYGEWKAEWASNADIGATRYLLNTGNAGSANNDLYFYVHANGRIYMIFVDDGGTSRNIRSSVNPVDFSEWFSVRGVIDFTDLSRSELYINGAVDHAGDTGDWTAGGGATFDTDGNSIRIGANRTGTVNGFHWTRELRINNQEIRAP